MAAWWDAYWIFEVHIGCIWGAYWTIKVHILVHIVVHMGLLGAYWLHMGVHIAVYINLWIFTSVCLWLHEILVNHCKSQMDVKRNLVSIMDYYLLCVMGYSVEKISLSKYDRTLKRYIIKCLKMIKNHCFALTYWWALN